MGGGAKRGRWRRVAFRVRRLCRGGCVVLGFSPRSLLVGKNEGFSGEVGVGFIGRQELEVSYGWGH
jgi:hypothetical protein